MLQEWLGHAQLSTMAIYADAVGKEEQDVAKRTWEQGSTPGPWSGQAPAPVKSWTCFPYRPCAVTVRAKRPSAVIIGTPRSSARVR